VSLPNHNHEDTIMCWALLMYLDSNLWAPEAQMHTSAIITDEREHEMAYLIRHFTEAIGPWYELSSTAPVALLTTT